MVDEKEIESFFRSTKKDGVAGCVGAGLAMGPPVVKTIPAENQSGMDASIASDFGTNPPGPEGSGAGDSSSWRTNPRDSPEAELPGSDRGLPGISIHHALPEWLDSQRV